MRPVVLLIVAGLLAPRLALAQTPARDLDTVLTGVRAYLTDYFARAQSIVADETVTIQQIRPDMMPEAAMARVLKNELRVSWEPAADGETPAATELRNLVSVNGRQPKDKDRDKCFDPVTESPEVLGALFLSDTATLEYKLGKPRKIRGVMATVIEIRDNERGPVTVEKKGEEEGCHSVSKPGMTRWRISVDPRNFAVIRFESFLSGLLDFVTPANKKNHAAETRGVFERVDFVTEFAVVSFSEPEESLLLPRTRTKVQIGRGAAGLNVRTSYTYRNYRRFMTGIRIVQ